MDIAKLCWQLWTSVRSPGLDLKMFLRPPAVHNRRGVGPNVFAHRLECYSGLKELISDFSGQIDIVLVGARLAIKPRRTWV